MPNQALIEFIEKYERFIITAHETPDGDALGSEYAMLLALRKLGKTARILNADPAPQKFAFIGSDKEFEVLVRKEQIPKDIGEYGLFILDVNDIKNIGQVATLILPRVKEYFIVDHHDSETVQLSKNHIEQSASSTCEILYLLFREMNLELDLPMARALYMGILYDTGSFIYPKTTAVTFQIALRSADIRVSIFFKENLEGIKRCSLRSKGNIDVAAIAQSLGGGGHRTAAGFKCLRPFEVMKVEILEMLRKYFDGETADTE
jgi:nanoRNase/pAp phosphatase (c-di-AMP/oligoRNAs hydrolase)